MKKVLVGGCFDVLHYGHIEFLRQAKALGDYLIVALEADENVQQRKGSLRPIHQQAAREQMLRSIRFVDEVINLPVMKDDRDYQQLVTGIKPSIIAITHGDPYSKQKELQAKAINAKIVVIPLLHTPATSQLAKLIGLEP